MKRAVDIFTSFQERSMASSDSAPKLIDVARHAGVSPATVSRVLNNNLAVNQQTRARVLAAATALGYQLPTAAREAAASPGTIAVQIGDIRNPFFHDMLRGILDEARVEGHNILLRDFAEDLQYEAQLLRELGEKRVAGVIALALRGADEELIALHERHHIPAVVVKRRISRPSIPGSVVDFADGAYRATQHLLQLGHTRLAYLPAHAWTEASGARQRGVARALEEVGLHLRQDWCVSTFPNIEGGFQAMSALVSLPAGDRPTGLIVYNDFTAIGALQAIRRAGLRVPDDFSIIGFDGITMGAYTSPPLTTVEQPRYRTGQLAMQLIRQMLAGRYTPSTGYIQLESPLVIRESTAPPRS
jgi:LacI family transcriptional regulator